VALTEWRIRAFWAWVLALLGAAFVVQSVNLAAIRPIMAGRLEASAALSAIVCMVVGAVITSIAWVLVSRLYFLHPYTSSLFRSHFAWAAVLAVAFWVMVFAVQMIQLRSNPAPTAVWAGVTPETRWRNKLTNKWSTPSATPPDNSGVWEPIRSTD
jgi:hypothetical protein